MNINEKAMLVKLSISQWSNRVIDRKVTGEVAQRYDVENREDKYVKALLPNLVIKPISNAVRDLRAFHNANTLPWQEDGVRILSSANFFNYQQGIAQRRANIETEVELFLKAYPHWVEQARTMRKGMFDETQYPDRDSLRQQYGVTVSFLPFPDVSDFRVDIDDGSMQEIKRQAESAIKDTMASANEHMIQRLHERVFLLHSALADPVRVFKNATFDSVLETAELVSLLNVSADTQVLLAVSITKDAMLGMSLDALRADPAYRSRAADTLARLLASLTKQE